MNQYFVYAKQPNSLKEHGEVYVPKIKTNFVILSTELDLVNVRNLPGVYEVRECEMGSLSV